jgi:malonyl-CoA O-methyltransferase
MEPVQVQQRAEDLSVGAVDLVWANMCLHAQPDPVHTFKQWARVLAVDGFLMFSTLGPGSLQGLAAVYRRLGWSPPFAPFVDMHDLGDMLLEAGLADPVMDQEQLCLSWPNAQALLDELRGLGGNAHPLRHPGLRTPRWAHHLRDALQGLAGPDGRPQLIFELVYGHAFKAAPKAALAPVTSVPLEDMRRMVRRSRSSP